MRTIAYLLSLLLVFMIPWEDVVQLPGVGTAARSMGLLVAGFWVVTVVVTGQLRKPGSFHLFACCYVLWNMLSVLWSAHGSRTLIYLVTFVQLLGLAFILWDLFTTRTKLLAGLQMYIAGAYVAIINTIVNYFSGSTYYYERFSATGTNPDDLGLILAIGIPIAWYLAISINTTRFQLLLKLANYIYIPAAIMGIALSGTRTALIATLPGLLFGLAALNRLGIGTRVVIFLFLVGLGIYMLPFIPQASLQRLESTGAELTQGDLNGRLTIWRDGFVSFGNHPILGVGANMFRSINVFGKVAHNTFLSVLVEVGLIGFVFFGLMVLTAVVEACRMPKWDSRLWLAVLFAWTIGVSTLTWEIRKPTWLILSLAIAYAGLTLREQQSALLLKPDVANRHFTPLSEQGGLTRFTHEHNKVTYEIGD